MKIQKESEEKVIVKYENDIYDVTQFLKFHPGGSNTIKQMNGKSIDEKFKFYGHSHVAENLLKDHKIRNNNEDDESIEVVFEISQVCFHFDIN
jgi:cytochrome b involved in lipid metabolism